MARILGANGVSFTTAAVERFHFNRPGRSVQMSAYNAMPQNFSARAKGRKKLNIPLLQEVAFVNRAMLLLSTWSTKTDDHSVHEIGLNNQRLANNFGAFHDYNFNRVDIPRSLLRSGESELYLFRIQRPRLGNQLARSGRYAGIPAKKLFSGKGSCCTGRRV
jgi:hypothetical protein